MYFQDTCGNTLELLDEAYVRSDERASGIDKCDKACLAGREEGDRR